MKAWILGSCLLLLACAAAAQENPEYGPVNIVAASSTEKGLEVANQLAKETASVLSEERTVKVNEVESLPAGAVTDADLVRVAGSRIHWVAVVNFDATSADHGVYEIEVAHVELQKVVSRVSAWIGKLPTTAANIGAALQRDAKAAAHEIAAYVSQYKLVRVILTLLTRPGNADYTVNNSDVNHTDSDGAGVWDHTLPAGSITVRVMKPGYADESRTIAISAPAEGQPFVPLSLTIDLHR